MTVWCTRHVQRKAVRWPCFDFTGTMQQCLDRRKDHIEVLIFADIV
jgi:hypothetical protein